VDLACLALRLQGFRFPHLWDVPRVYAKVAFSAWATRQVLALKRRILFERRRPRGPLGGPRAELLDRSLDAAGVVLWALVVSDWLSVELGLALKGAFALGSLGTLALTLAGNDLASQVVSGLFLQAGNKMRVGEKVSLSESKASGKVVKIGLTDTVLRASDNTVRSASGCPRPCHSQREYGTSLRNYGSLTVPFPFSLSFARRSPPSPTPRSRKKG
jgi:hypothetical protein